MPAHPTKNAVSRSHGSIAHHLTIRITVRDTLELSESLWFLFCSASAVAWEHRQHRFTASTAVRSELISLRVKPPAGKPHMAVGEARSLYADATRPVGLNFGGADPSPLGVSDIKHRAHGTGHVPVFSTRFSTPANFSNNGSGRACNPLLSVHFSHH